MPGEARPAAPVSSENVAAPPAASAGPAPTPPSPTGQASSPPGDPPVAPAPRISEREDTRPRGKVVLVVHASQAQAAEAAAEQLAPRVGLVSDQVVAKASADLPARAVIRFYAAADHALARRIGQELSRMGYSWRIENLSDRGPSKGQAPEVWLPDR